jgi:hypothetical protein
LVTISEIIEFMGHPMIRATHPTTLEVTKDDQLTSRGDCIVGISADRGLADLPDEIKRAIRSDAHRVRMTLETTGHSFKFAERGDPRLSLSSKKDVVIRRSLYTCDRTLAVLADVAARDIPRRIVHSLRDANCLGRLRIEVEMP